MEVPQGSIQLSHGKHEEKFEEVVEVQERLKHEQSEEKGGVLRDEYLHLLQFLIPPLLLLEIWEILLEEEVM